MILNDIESPASSFNYLPCLCWLASHRAGSEMAMRGLSNNETWWALQQVSQSACQAAVAQAQPLSKNSTAGHSVWIPANTIGMRSATAQRNEQHDERKSAGGRRHATLGLSLLRLRPREKYTNDCLFLTCIHDINDICPYAEQICTASSNRMRREDAKQTRHLPPPAFGLCTRISLRLDSDAP
jgi:hypothetical protein